MRPSITFREVNDGASRRSVRDAEAGNPLGLLTAQIDPERAFILRRETAPLMNNTTLSREKERKKERRANVIRGGRNFSVMFRFLLSLSLSFSFCVESHVPIRAFLATHPPAPSSPGRAPSTAV